MKQLTALFIFCFYTLSFSAENPTVSQFDIDSIGGETRALDLDIDFGYAPKENSEKFLSRLRVGLLAIKGSNIKSLGAVVGWYGQFGLGLGAEVEWLNLPSGLWAQVSALTTRNEPLVTSGAVGWSVLGFEVLTSPFHFDKTLWLLKLRLPLGVALAGSDFSI